MTTEHLIEKAAKAIWFARHVGENVEWGEMAWAEQTAPDDWSSEALDALDAARAAWAVFEEAHTPTNDEQEAAITKAYNAVTGQDDDEWNPDKSLDALHELWDRAASFRHTEVPEPSALPDYFAPKPMPQVTFADRLSARSDFELGRLAGRDEIRAEQEERRRNGVWGEHPGHSNAEPQGEPSDATVEAGCVAFYEGAQGLTSWARLVSAEPDLATRYRDGIRAALRATGGVR